MSRREEIENQIKELQKELVNMNENLFCILVRSYFPDIYIFGGCWLDVLFGKRYINQKSIRYIPYSDTLLTWDDNHNPIYLNPDTLVELLKELKIMYSNNYRKEDLKGY